MKKMMNFPAMKSRPGYALGGGTGMEIKGCG
jgi:hypothetical protein